MSATSAFSARLIGETEKTLNAILDRNLAGPGLTEQHWITLTFVIVSGGRIDRNELVRQVVNGAKFSEQDVRARVSELVASQCRQDDARWRVHDMIGDTIQSVTVAPAMTADGRPSRRWNPRRIDIRFLGQRP